MAYSPTRRMEMSDLQHDWDRELTSFSNELTPPAAALTEANQIVTRLFRLLQSKSKYSIDRQMLFGSVAKKTAVKTEFDFDSVIFINDVEPPFAEVLSDFEDIINMSEMNARIKESTDPNRAALSVTIDGIKFDLVPAVNYRVSNRSPEEQRQGTMRRIRSLPNPAKDAIKYNTSLSEYQVQFLQDQTEFARSVIRLAKYWNKTVFLSEFVQGRSLLIEYIATHAANREEIEIGCHKSVWNAFNRFLQSIVNFNQLNIVFDKFYKRHEVNPATNAEMPLVLDPVNPFINFARALSKSPKPVQKLQSAAKETISRLKLNETVPDMAVLFQTQPTIAPAELLARYLAKEGSYLVGVYDLSREASENPKMMVRNEAKYNRIGVSLFQSYLSNNVEILKATHMPKTRLQEKVHDVIDINILGYASRRNWSDSTKKHEDHDITFEVPCSDKIIKVSFNWP